MIASQLYFHSFKISDKVGQANGSIEHYKCDKKCPEHCKFNWNVNNNEDKKLTVLCNTKKIEEILFIFRYYTPQIQTNSVFIRHGTIFSKSQAKPMFAKTHSLLATILSIYVQETWMCKKSAPKRAESVQVSRINRYLTLFRPGEGRMGYISEINI